jgi:cell division initiation protein
MSYSGLEIQLKDFNRSIRGFDTDEVKSFLDDIARQVETLEYENKVLKDKIREKDMMLLEFREREMMLKDTVLTAQRITDGIKKEAEKESESIIRQANIKADAIVSDAREKMRQTLDAINRLKRQKLEITSKVRSILNTHMQMLQHYEEEEATNTYKINMSDINKVTLSKNV